MSEARRYIQPRERGLFDGMNRLLQIDDMGDSLAHLNEVMDWSIFQSVLDRIPRAEAKGPGGRPSFPPLLMFKILVLQSLYGLSDEQTQYQILDRRSFHRFLGLIEADRVPDQNTIREFREKLTAAKLFDELFEVYHQRLSERGLMTRKGSLVDASFVEVPRQRNTGLENAEIKEGKIPEGWNEDRKRLAHKDLDARWAKKNQETYYGYKNHVNVDLESKLIVRAAVTHAAVHDSQGLDAVTRKGDPPTTTDAGYAGPECAEVLRSKEIMAHICEKGQRGRPLTRRQKRANRKKSRQRARVEHVFGFMTGSMKAMHQRYVGLVRNTAAIIFSNLVYNMARTEQIIRLKLFGKKTPKLA
jgi:transposase, IS5 family